MITFIAHFRVTAENTAAFEELLNYVVAKSNAEPGVVYYGMSKSVLDSETYAVVEVYRDEDAVAAHGQTEWVTSSVPKFLSLIEGVPDIQQYVSPGTAAVTVHFDDTA